MNHSPGPLFVSEPPLANVVYNTGGDDDYFINDDNGHCLGVAHYRIGYGHHANARANAVLWANAGKLLEACEAAYKWLCDFGEHSPIVYGGEGELAELLGIAITKAKGES